MPHDQNNTWTSDALQRGDIGAIRQRVLDDSSYVHERDHVGNTPLRTAIEFDNLELVRFLLEHGSDPNVEVDDGYTCLLVAVESDTDETRIVAELIRAGADIHADGTNGWTPLHLAAARGHVAKARLLIEAGANVNVPSVSYGSETPLMEAAAYGQPSTVRLLLEHGADASVRDTSYNRTPLEIAEYVAKGADPDDIAELPDDLALLMDQLETVMQTLKDCDVTQNYIDNSNELAKTGNHAEVIRILTEHRRSLPG